MGRVWSPYYTRIKYGILLTVWQPSAVRRRCVLAEVMSWQEQASFHDIRSVEGDADTSVLAEAPR